MDFQQPLKASLSEPKTVPASAFAAICRRAWVWHYDPSQAKKQNKTDFTGPHCVFERPTPTTVWLIDYGQTRLFTVFTVEVKFYMTGK